MTVLARHARGSLTTSTSTLSDLHALDELERRTKKGFATQKKRRRGTVPRRELLRTASDIDRRLNWARIIALLIHFVKGPDHRCRDCINQLFVCPLRPLSSVLLAYNCGVRPEELV